MTGHRAAVSVAEPIFPFRSWHSHDPEEAIQRIITAVEACETWFALNQLRQPLDAFRRAYGAPVLRIDAAFNHKLAEIERRYSSNQKGPAHHGLR